MEGLLIFTSKQLDKISTKNGLADDIELFPKSKKKTIASRTFSKPLNSEDIKFSRSVASQVEFK